MIPLILIWEKNNFNIINTDMITNILRIPDIIVK